MDRTILYRKSGALALFLFSSLFIFLTPEAQAGCRNSKPVCENPNICLSNRRDTNSRDMVQPLHRTLCGVLNSMEKKFGKLEILAAYRKDNAARGGAKNSMHLKLRGGPTMAVDIFRPANRHQMYQFLGSEKCKGIRYNIYCGTGTVHVDVSSLKDNYSRCRDFFRASCGGGNDPGGSEGYKSAAVAKYKARNRQARPRCWHQKKWGSCCGPSRKRHGYCTG